MAGEPILQAISEVAHVNPPLTKAVAPDQEVSFIPMADVSDTGQLTGRQTRRQRELAVGYTSFEERDVLFAKITPCMENGKGCHALGLVNGVGYGSTEFHVLRVKPGTNDRFLYFWLVTDEVRKKAEAFMIGSAGQQRVQTAFFDHFHIPRLDEDAQSFAARVLDAADEAIAKTEALIAKLKAIKQGLLHDLLIRGIDENGELRDPEKHPEQFKQSLIGLLPKTWTCAAVRELSETFAGGTPPRNTAGMFGGAIPWVKSAEVNLREISSTEEALTERGFFASSTRWVEAGSPLIAMYGATAGVVGWLAVRAVTNQAVLAIPPRSPDTNARWLYWVLRCRQWRLQAAIQGSGQPNLSKGIIDDIALPAPKPKEQIQIASLMDSLEDRLLSEELYCVKLKSIKKGLMQDLLTGRVRVNAEAWIKER